MQLPQSSQLPQRSIWHESSETLSFGQWHSGTWIQPYAVQQGWPWHVDESRGCDERSRLLHQLDIRDKAHSFYTTTDDHASVAPFHGRIYTCTPNWFAQQDSRGHFAKPAYKAPLLHHHLEQCLDLA